MEMQHSQNQQKLFHYLDILVKIEVSFTENQQLHASPSIGRSWLLF